ncbi:ZIP family metal transporter [Candidatus Woesearchaeota archaeon]|nr:ZIP family metal transporter [Candidatus Woesearchaeota archaeon]
MLESWLYTLGSVFLVSVLSLVGAVTLSLSKEVLKKMLIYLVGFSAGAFFGDVFFHLLPEATTDGFTLSISIALLLGFLFSFIVEKYIHWRHCHHATTENHPHPVAIMNLVGDSIHNFVDGVLIAASYLVAVPVGIATTIAVVFHEIPQEIGDFGVLVYGGFSRSKALFLNFLTAVTAVVGAIMALLLSSRIPGMTAFLIPFAAGNFLYVAAADLVPEMHKETAPNKSLLQVGAFILGLTLMGLLIFLE